MGPKTSVPMYTGKIDNNIRDDNTLPSTHSHSLTPSTNMSDISASFDVRQKYRHFRILVIGRANAGKTTLLKRVCNTTDEPCIYDEKSNSLVRFLA